MYPAPPTQVKSRGAQSALSTNTLLLTTFIEGTWRNGALPQATLGVDQLVLSAAKSCSIAGRITLSRAWPDTHPAMIARTTPLPSMIVNWG